MIQEKNLWTKSALKCSVREASNTGPARGYDELTVVPAMVRGGGRMGATVVRPLFAPDASVFFVSFRFPAQFFSFCPLKDNVSGHFEAILPPDSIILSPSSSV